MFDAIKRVTEKLDEKKIRYDFGREENRLRVPFGLESGDVMIHVIFNDDDTGFALRCFNIAVLHDKTNREAFCEAVNALNDDYRFVKFVIDDKERVDLEFDMSDSADIRCIGQAVYEMLMRTCNILDDEIPYLMQAAWKGEWRRDTQDDKDEDDEEEDDEEEDEDNGQISFEDLFDDGEEE